MDGVHEERAIGSGSALVFRGWLVVGGAFGVMFVGFGAAYTFGAFFEPLQHEFDASRGGLSLVFSVAAFLYFALGAASGLLADRVGSRIVCCLGMAVLAAGLLGAALADTLWGVCVAYGLGVGVGNGLAYVPSIGAVQHWFVRRRGLASGIAVAGIGVGTLAMPPLATALIDGLGWRHAYLVLAAIALLVGGGAALLVDSAPGRSGNAPEGDPRLRLSAAPAARGLALGEAMRTRPFWHLAVASMLASFGVFMPFVHLVPYAQGEGVARGTAVLLFGLIGIGSTLARFVFGGIADRVGRRVASAAMFLGLALVTLFWLGAHGPLTLGVFAFAFGAFYGGFVALVPALIADYFGTRDLSSIIGILYSGVAIGSLVGPTAAGYAYDLAASYTMPIVLAAALDGLAFLLVLAAPEPAGWHARRPAVMA